MSVIAFTGDWKKNIMVFSNSICLEYFEYNFCQTEFTNTESSQKHPLEERAQTFCPRPKSSSKMESSSAVEELEFAEASAGAGISLKDTEQ